MKRTEFLRSIGAGAAFVLTATCLGSCSKENTSVTQDVDFVLDLSKTNNSILQNNGGFVIQNGVVVAKDLTGTYVAATQICSHEDRSEIIFKNDEWFCSAHGARFKKNGNGINSDANKGLTIYQTQLSGNQLRIFS